MVAERERGLRAETQAGAPAAGPRAHPGLRDAQRSGKHVAGFFRHLGPLLDRELAGTGLWLATSQPTPLDTVRMILAHGAAGRL